MASSRWLRRCVHSRPHLLLVHLPDSAEDETNCAVLAEAARAISPHGRLSRGVAGTVDRCLVCNVPGSPKGAVESLDAIIDVVPHALELMAGEQPHH